MEATRCSMGTRAGFSMKKSAGKGSSFMGKTMPKARCQSKALSASQRLMIEAAKEYEYNVDKPLGVKLGDKGGKGGGVLVKSVQSGGNAAKAGLKVGDQVIYHSSFFGDELWPADSLGFTNTAINACPDDVDFIVIRGADIGTVDVKRIPKRPKLAKFGRKLTAAQKERATHLCVDCGFIYYLPTPFAEQPNTYICPQCQAPKTRFAEYDPITGKVKSIGVPPSVLISAVIGVLGFVAFALVGFDL